MAEPVINIEIKKIQAKTDDELFFLDQKCSGESITHHIEMCEKQKQERHELLNKQKQVIPGKLYLAYYKVYDETTAEKLEYGHIGIFDTHYNAIEACRLTKKRLTIAYEEDDVYIYVRYTENTINHIVV